MFQNAWDQRHEQAVSASAHLKREMKEIAALSEKLLERIVETDNPAVIAAYEKKIADLETRKLLITEKLQNWSNPHSDRRSGRTTGGVGLWLPSFRKACLLVDS
jgi:site-specific DNA recombinase